MSKSASHHSVQSLDPANFRADLGGKPVALYSLRNSKGMQASITNYGAKIEQLLVPDSEGRLVDVVLGYESLEAAVGGAPSMGAFIGRYAGRIENACFTLAGTRHQLNANDGPHCLHGGSKGSRVKVFDAYQIDAASVEMRCVFEDGEEGFPGALSLRLVYRVSEANELVLTYEAMALSQPTVASFTTHAFFNLNGHPCGSVGDHKLMICADNYLAMSADLVATGEHLPVAQTLLDWRQPVLLGTRLRCAEASPDGDKQLLLAGYDHCYEVRRPDGYAGSGAGALALCARISAAASGLTMAVWSTEPVMQLYTGLLPHAALAGTLGKGGQMYCQQQGLCLEPQGYPNAPNLPQFPSAIYWPGQSRRGQTLYGFGTSS